MTTQTKKKLEYQSISAAFSSGQCAQQNINDIVFSNTLLDLSRVFFFFFFFKEDPTKYYVY